MPRKVKPLVERVADIIPHNFLVIGNFTSFEEEQVWRNKQCVNIAKRIINMVTKHNHQLHMEATTRLIGHVLDRAVKNDKEYRDRAEEG